jgi:toxin CptA
MAVSVMCLGIAFAAGMIGFAKVGELPVYLRLFTAAGCLFSAVLGFYWHIREKKSFHIDISGIGQIRLTEYSGAGSSDWRSERLSEKGSGEIYRLMPDSTIWPYLLLLRLQHERRVIVLPVLYGSVAPGNFRTLSVACRWIAAQNNRPKHELA